MSYSDLSIKKRDTASPTPCCTITQHARIEGDSVAAKKLGAFTGEVWLDPILSASDTFIGLVNFLPSARTNWHRHDKGQVLRVLGGAGWYCDQGEKPRRIAAGDVIWCPPGVVHWHGADDGSYMVHEATSLGKVDWYEAVSDEEYAAKTK